MKNFYLIADHVISIDDELDMYISKMDNYKPFLTDRTDNVILNVKVVKELNLNGDKIVQFINGDEQQSDMSRIDLYRVGTNWLFELAPNKKAPICAQLMLDETFSEGSLFIFSEGERYTRFALNTSMMVAYAFRTAFESTIEIHSSVIEKDGKGYMFMGVSGTGKSTHSNLWLKHIEGTSLLNDDNPIIRIIDDKVYVYGSPWSGKTPCYKQRRALAGAFVKLTQFPSNEIKKMTSLDSYACIYSSTSGYKQNSSLADALHETFERIIFSVPFYHLKCLPDREAAVLCSSTVVDKN